MQPQEKSLIAISKGIFLKHDILLIELALIICIPAFFICFLQSLKFLAHIDK